MDTNAIQIAVRVRPFSAKEEPHVIRQIAHPTFMGDGGFSSPMKPVASGSIRQVIDVIDHRMLNFDKPERAAGVKKGLPGGTRYKDRNYTFDQVLGMEATQEDVFRKTALPLLEGVLTGFNATVFAYGATGCGKTHTITGTPEDQGVIFRTTAELFRLMDETNDEFDTHLEVSMVEIYNETIRDLLDADPSGGPAGGLRLLENERHRVSVRGATLRRPTSVEQVMEMVVEGNTRRSTSFTAMNSQSSRSHAILQINVGRNAKGHTINKEESVVRTCITSATLSIIDLAGSERAAATANLGARMKEGANINKSLLALSSCIKALCTRPVRGIKPHVPYRNSKLTRMLKFSLGGNCRTVMIVCVSPSSKDIEDTYNTLLWADKAKEVQTKVSRNTAGYDVRSAQYIEALAQKEEEIKQLKMTIARMGSDNKSWNDDKRSLQRKDMNRIMLELEGQLELGVPDLAAGAGYRAEWDDAEMIVTALKERLAGLDDKEDVAYVNSLIQQQCARVQNNVAASNAVRQEQTKRRTLESILRNADSRTFGDSADAADIEVLKLTIRLHESEMKRRELEAREVAYRKAVQKHAKALARVATVLRKMQTELRKQDDALVGIASRVPGNAGIGAICSALQGLAGDGQDALSTLFLAGNGGLVLPPMPTAEQLREVSPIKADAGRSVFDAGPPRPYSMTSAPSDISFALGVQASPAGKRLLGGAGGARRSPGSPGKRRYGDAKIKSCLKTKTKLFEPSPAAVQGMTDPGNVRFAESNDYKTMTSESSFQESADEVGADTSGDGIAPPTVEIAPMGPNSGQTKKTMALPGRAARSRGSIYPTARLSPPSSSSTSSRAGASAAGPAAAGRNAIRPLGTGFDREGTSSPEVGPAASRFGSSGLGAFGPPTRIPLDERHNAPGANSSFTASRISGLPNSGSGATRPTESSMRRMDQAGLGKPRPSISGLGGPLSSGLGAPSKGRVSSIGAMRNERPRARSSMAPVFGKPSGPGGLGASGSGSGRAEQSFSGGFSGGGRAGASSGFGMPSIPASPSKDGEGSSDGADADVEADEGKPSSTTAPVKEAPARYNPLAGGASRLHAPTQSSLMRRNSVLNLAPPGGGGAGMMGAGSLRGRPSTLALGAMGGSGSGGGSGTGGMGPARRLSTMPLQTGSRLR